MIGYFFYKAAHNKQFGKSGSDLVNSNLMHTYNIKMKTNVQYIANATFAKLPDVIGNTKKLTT